MARRENAPRLRNSHLSHAPFVEVIIGRGIALRDVGSQKSVPETQNQDWWGPGLPILAHVLITAQELQAILTVGDGPVNFPLDLRATFSAPLSNPGPPSSKSTTISGISGKPITKFFTEPLNCGWDSILFSHAFLIIPESPPPNLGRDILSNMQASSHMKWNPQKTYVYP